MIPLTNYDFQWGRSEVVIIYPEWSPSVKLSSCRSGSNFQIAGTTQSESESGRMASACKGVLRIFIHHFSHISAAQGLSSLKQPEKCYEPIVHWICVKKVVKMVPF